VSLNEILEHLPKLTEDEKRQLWNILDQLTKAKKARNSLQNWMRAFALRIRVQTPRSLKTDPWGLSDLLPDPRTEKGRRSRSFQAWSTEQVTAPDGSRGDKANVNG
jgi:hypothetical protein